MAITGELDLEPDATYWRMADCTTQISSKLDGN